MLPKLIKLKLNFKENNLGINIQNMVNLGEGLE